MALTYDEEIAYRNQLLSIWGNDGLIAAQQKAISDGQNMILTPSTKTSPAIIANPNEVRANALNDYTYGNVSPAYIQSPNNGGFNWIPWLIGGVVVIGLLKKKRR